jgi:hypothetical protein
VTVAGNAWIGPIGAVPGSACWECGWLRLLGTIERADPAWAAHQPVDPPAPAGESGEPFLSGPLVSLIAATAAFGYFTTAAQSTVEDSGFELIRIKLRSAECTRHRFEPHPRCTSHGWSSISWVAAGSGGLALGSVVEPIAELTAEVAGELQALRALDEAGRQQLPLCVVESTVADLAASGAGLRTVVAAGQTNLEARRRSVTLAAELAAEDLIRWYGRAGREGLDGLAAPDGDAGGRSGWVSAGAGASPAEAAGRALLRLCHRLIVADPGRWHDATVAPLDESVAGPLAASALLLDDTLQTVELAAPPRTLFATVAVRSRDTVLSAVTAPTRPEAMSAALEFAVVRLQGAAAIFTELPGDLGDAEWAERCPALVDWLAGQGRPARLTPVDLDASLAQLAPHFMAATIAPLASGEPSC